MTGPPEETKGVPGLVNIPPYTLTGCDAMHWLIWVRQHTPFLNNTGENLWRATNVNEIHKPICGGFAPGEAFKTSRAS